MNITEQNLNPNGYPKILKVQNSKKKFVPESITIRNMYPKHTKLNII